MPVTVLSPFSGKPVKVRDQDVGRAVRDEEGRIFYVLPKSDGSGYYGATTRSGNPKEETRALSLEGKTAVAADNTRQQVASMHDATGRRGVNGKLIVLLFVLLVVVLAYLAKYGPWGDLTKKWTQPPPPNPIIEGGARPAN